jgi:hypothetical protein
VVAVPKVFLMQARRSRIRQESIGMTRWKERKKGKKGAVGVCAAKESKPPIARKGEGREGGQFSSIHEEFQVGEQ